MHMHIQHRCTHAQCMTTVSVWHRIVNSLKRLVSIKIQYSPEIVPVIAEPQTTTNHRCHRLPP